jgi:2-polyprenyl-6-methoxyphenol hydroxylase-like FAD-dependent oxidoreductase
MHPQNHDAPDVLVVGAGPAGLTAAATLGRLGIATLVVERRRELSGLPRATGVSTRSMEIFRSFGIEDAILAGGVDVAPMMLSCTTLTAAADGMPVPIGLPTRDQAAVISPTGPACVPQDHLEPVLLDYVRGLGVAVELGTELVDITPSRDGASVTLRDTGTNCVRTVSARYVVAADGAHSRVRTGLGIPMHGPDGLGEAASAVFHAPLWAVAGEHRYVVYDIRQEGAAGVLLPAGRDDRWLYGVLWQTGEDDAASFDEERFTRQIRLAAGVPDLPVSIERIGSFVFAAKLAERFRDGRVFLVGDAAHRVTPRGGTGMNSAIHDGYDVGWKLGWVLKGWAPEELLDSYEPERRPVVEHNAARSANRESSMRGADRALYADLGGRIPHLRVHTAEGPASTLDLLGPGLTVFCGPGGGSWEHPSETATDRVPVTVRRLDAVAARALGILPGAALVVRPDGVAAAAPAAIQGMREVAEAA